MPTTTIRLSAELKSRIARVAGRSGKTAHGFVLEAIAEKTENEERRAEFHAEADRRYAKILATGKAIPWDDMRAYLEKRLAGRPPTRPVARKLNFR
jgi:predicted transcriptional regulator